MKISSAIVALCLVSEANAFMVQSPAALRQSITSESNLSSYLGDFGDNDDTRTRGFVPASQIKDMKTSKPGDGAMEQSSQGATPMEGARDIWDNLAPIICQGGSLRTWSFTTPFVERVQVIMKTEGRPLNANVDLWQGPDNTPQKMAVFIEDGDMRPFCAVIETPGGENTIAIRNTAQVEFPLAAAVGAEVSDANGNIDVNSRLSAGVSSLPSTTVPKVIQGGAIKTYSFDPDVASVQILLKTDGRPLNARLELLQGPNNNKQVIELYTEDGMRRPFYMVIETPGNGNVVRVINTAPVEFPLSASVEPFMIDTEIKDAFVISSGGWDNGSRF